MMDWLLSLIPWWAYLLAAAVVIGAVWRLLGWHGAIAAAAGFLAAFGYGKGRVDAYRDEQSRQSKARDNLQEHYDEIDRQPVDPAASYDRLRGMSDSARGR